MTRLLLDAPTEDELARMYWELAELGAPSAGAKRPWRYQPASREEIVCLAAEMCRHDARLLTVLVAWLRQSWEALNPLALRREMPRMKRPQALCVTLSFVRSGRVDPELRRMVAYVCAGWRPVSPVEQFFFDGDRPGSKLGERRFGRSLAEYSRWGFLGLERPQTDVYRKTTVGRFDRASRIDLLRKMAKRRGEITLTEYLGEIDHAISRPQAVHDARAAGLVLRGRKRGGRWVWPAAGARVAVEKDSISIRVRGAETTTEALAGQIADVTSEPDDRGWMRVRAAGRSWELRAADVTIAEGGAHRPSRRRSTRR